MRLPSLFIVCARPMAYIANNSSFAFVSHYTFHTHRLQSLSSVFFIVSNCLKMGGLPACWPQRATAAALPNTPFCLQALLKK